jgi:hypothetical protein
MPKSENLTSFIRSDETTDPLADRQIQVRLTRNVDAAVRSLPNKTAWLRRVIAEAAQRELMKDGDRS